MSDQDPDLRGRPLIFGEVLFDSFPDGSQVLGGAPFNVAWHLQGFGMAPVFASRVGNDPEGDRVLEAMQSWGMDTSAMQRDPDHPTGAVLISMQGRDARFDIRPDQAYDHIDGGAVRELAAARDFSALYHGSLIARSTANAQTLQELAVDAALPVFVDVNLRDPWWNAGTVTEMAHRARWVKLNEDEMANIMPASAGGDAAKAAEELRRAAGLELVIVTQGARGAFIASIQGVVADSPPPPGEIVDTVGAGDAFSSVALLGLHAGWSHERILSRALSFASAICEQRGATSENRDLYQRHLQHWER